MWALLPLLQLAIPSHFSPEFWSQMIWSRYWLLSCQSPLEHTYPPGVFDSSLDEWSLTLDSTLWFPHMTKNHSSFPRHPDTSLVEVKMEIFLILKKSQHFSFSELDFPVSKRMCSVLDLLQGFCFFHLRLKKLILIFLWNITSPPLNFRSDPSIVSNSWRSAFNTSSSGFLHVQSVSEAKSR